MGRYNPRNSEGVYWVETIAIEATPTVAEMTAAEPLHIAIRSLSGFSFTGSTIPADDMSTTFPKTIEGLDQVPDSTIEFYRGNNTADDERAIETALAKGSDGYIVFSPYTRTIIATTKVEVWPARVMSNSPNKTADAAPATFTVTFSHPEAPTQTAAVIA